MSAFSPLFGSPASTKQPCAESSVTERPTRLSHPDRPVAERGDGIGDRRGRLAVGDGLIRWHAGPFHLAVWLTINGLSVRRQSPCQHAGGGSAPARIVPTA